jgi:DNA topoisomerase-3
MVALCSADPAFPMAGGGKKETQSQFKVIERLLRQVDDVVISTDADREGEVIARELLEYCRWDGPVQRLWLSALDEMSIRAALQDLRPGAETLGMYHAGLGRARADWLIGMNLSRLYTLLAVQSGFDGVVSVGRVQTPTLALVVRRDREIATFIPKPFWQVKALMSAGGELFRRNGCRRRFIPTKKSAVFTKTSRSRWHIFAGRLEHAVVTECDTKREKAAAPLAFSLGTAAGLWQAVGYVTPAGA